MEKIPKNHLFLQKKWLNILTSSLLKKRIGGLEGWITICMITALFLGGLFLLQEKDPNIEREKANFLTKSTHFVKAAKAQNVEEEETEGNPIITIQGNSLLSFIEPSCQKSKVTQRLRVVITAYSSTPEETDDTPFITAAGTQVRDGIIANNLLPFGTKVKIPEIYGNKIFVVEDRMHRRKGYYHVDIWFPSYHQALNFGAKRTYIEVLEG